jgi:uncharacterized protein YegP (UPF0339 family)
MYFEIYPTTGAGGAMGGLFGALAATNALAPQWRWRLKSANHEILASGESYVHRRDCEHVVSLLQQTSIMTPVRAVAA